MRHSGRLTFTLTLSLSRSRYPGLSWVTKGQREEREWFALPLDAIVNTPALLLISLARVTIVMNWSRRDKTSISQRREALVRSTCHFIPCINELSEKISHRGNGTRKKCTLLPHPLMSASGFFSPSPSLFLCFTLDSTGLFTFAHFFSSLWPALCITFSRNKVRHCRGRMKRLNCKNVLVYKWSEKERERERDHWSICNCSTFCLSFSHSFFLSSFCRCCWWLQANTHSGTHEMKEIKK